MQEASDAHSKTADSDTVSTYQVSSVQLVTDKKLEALLVTVTFLFYFKGTMNQVFFCPVNQFLNR